MEESSPKESGPITDVVVGIVPDALGRYLVTKRSKKAHLGGLWEFPGGKVEPGETRIEALKRELFEEVGIQISHASPFMRLIFSYTEKTVRLNIFYVAVWEGEAYGKERQPLRWEHLSQLSDLPFPDANVEIIRRLHLERRYAITPADIPSSPLGVQTLFGWLEKNLQSGVKLLQLRLPVFSDSAWRSIADDLRSFVKASDGALLVNGSNFEVCPEWADGLHLTSRQLLESHDHSFRVSKRQWLGASCHSLDELEAAQRNKMDYVTLSPVNKTASHPNQSTLGWAHFAQLSEQAWLPCYALGGVESSDSAIAQAERAGAYGVAGIQSFL